MYPLQRTLRISPFVTLQGAWRPNWHSGGSCGVSAASNFSGELLLEWEMPNARSWYSAFGAGMVNLHVRSTAGVDAVRFIGSQQCSTIDNVVIRGFGEATGLLIAGDTYTLRRVYVDAQTSGGTTVQGSTGIKQWGARLYNIQAEAITTHNCDVGVSLSDVQTTTLHGLETETTNTPIEITYQARATRITNIMAQHHQRIASITRKRFPRQFSLQIQGMAEKGSNVVKLPDGAEMRLGTEFDAKI